MKKQIAGSLCALLLCATPALGATIYRCTDQAGQLTFTRHGCSTQETVQVADAVNQTPGSGRAVPLAKPQQRKKKSGPEASDAVTVVGERDDGCGNLIQITQLMKW